MSDEDLLNGHEVVVAMPMQPEELPSDWRTWISETRVCARLGVNPRQLKKMIDKGEVPPGSKAPDATWRWNPATIDDLEDMLSGGANPAAEISAGGRASRDMSVGLAKLVGQATQHAERSFVQHERATNAALRTLRDINNDLREDNSRLRSELAKREETHLALVKQREDLLSDQTARDIAAKESATTTERKRKMFDLVMQRAPNLLGKLEKTLGLGEGSDMKKVQAVISLAEDLDPGLLEMLASNGALTPKQVELVEQIIGKKIAKPTEEPTEPAAAAAETSGTTPAPSAPEPEKKTDAPNATP